MCVHSVGGVSWGRGWQTLAVLICRELEIATYGVGVADAEVGGAAPTDPLVADICHEFAVCLQTFEDSSKARLLVIISY